MLRSRAAQTMSSSYNAFVEELAHARPPANVCNPYAPGSEHNAIRRANLRLYLQQVEDFRPRLLLVGEAPGYRGCRLTGVPFSSERILLEGIEELGLFGACRGYRKTGETAAPAREQSASIVWGAMREYNVVPLAWNAFPFHPHLPGNEASNRPPSRRELQVGEYFLKALLELFEVETVIAVGNQAGQALARLGVPAHRVRHPSHGGKKLFLQGCREVLAGEGLCLAWEGVDLA